MAIGSTKGAIQIVHVVKRYLCFRLSSNVVISSTMVLGRSRLGRTAGNPTKLKRSAAWELAGEELERPNCPLSIFDGTIQLPLSKQRMFLSSCPARITFPTLHTLLRQVLSPLPCQNFSILCTVYVDAGANGITWTIGAKSKRHKRKKGGGKGKENGNLPKLNGVKKEEEHDHDEAEVEQPETPTELEQLYDTQEEPEPNGVRELPSSSGSPTSNPVHASQESIDEEERTKAIENFTGNRSRKTTMIMPEVQAEVPKSPQGNRSRKPTMVDETQMNGVPSIPINDTETRLDALARERAALKDEVTQLRRSLEEIQGKHEEELGSFREQLEDTQVEKEHAESQYRNLLGKVNQIRSQLGERLKADAVGMPRMVTTFQLTVR